MSLTLDANRRIARRRAHLLSERARHKDAIRHLHGTIRRARKKSMAQAEAGARQIRRAHTAKIREIDAELARLEVV